jgi:lipoprotein-anchoring transpeptidase ErfK/SrfK
MLKPIAVVRLQATHHFRRHATSNDEGLDALAADREKTMELRRIMSRSVFAACAAVIAAGVPLAGARAQGAVQYDWGGDKEWGGGKQLVTFNPTFKQGHIVVSFGDRRLYHVVRPGQAVSYPIAIPREQSRWQGLTNVSQKRENPSWTPTPDMLRENPRLPTWVPGGHPMNPLGVRALYLGSSTYRIHGTDAPWTIGQAVSKGCIRMFNEDVIDLYPKVNVGASVTVTWQRFNAQPSSQSVAAAGANDEREQNASRANPDERRIPLRRYMRSSSLSKSKATQSAAIE